MTLGLKGLTILVSGALLEDSMKIVWKIIIFDYEFKILIFMEVVIKFCKNYLRVCGYSTLPFVFQRNINKFTMFLKNLW